MSLSAQEVSLENLDTASAIRTETVTASHQFKVFDYSLTKGIGIGKCFNSDVFTIAGYNWIIKYYPDGFSEADKSFISMYLHLVNAATNVNVKARSTFTVLQQNGVPSDVSFTSPVRTYHTYYPSWGYCQFFKRSEFEESECLKDDAFTVKCTVTVLKCTKLEAINPCGVIVPPSNLSQNWADLLESGKGADITFVVNGEKFTAHRVVLATRSAVFNAMFFGGMKENATDTINIEDIEAPVFKSLLHFIYSDSLPNIEGKHDLRPMAEHLLVAADRYELERLKLMCEDVLCRNLDVNNAATTLILAERHNCSQLKTQCLGFLSNPGVFKEVALTPVFQNLMKMCPLF